MWIDRRQFLNSACGVGGVALASLLNDHKLLATSSLLHAKAHDTTPKSPHSFGRAKAMISMFMQGGPSHIDLFDPKPELVKLDGKDFPGEVKYDDAAGQCWAWTISPTAGCHPPTRAPSFVPKSLAS